MTKRVFAVVALLFAAASLFAAGQQEGADAAADLEYWFTGPNVLMDFMRDAVDEFNRQPGGTVIDFVEAPNSVEAISTALAGGQGPDIMYYNQNVVWLFGADSIYPITEFVKDSAIGIQSDAFMPSQRMSVNYGGEVIALPMAFGLGAVKYNRTLVEEAGLDISDPPQTWDEFEQWMAALTIVENGETVQYALSADSVDWLLQEIMFANGGDWNADDMSEYAPYTEELIQGIAWIDRMVNELGYMATPRGLGYGGSAAQMRAGEQGFVNGIIAMQIGYHAWDNVVDQNPDLKGNIGIFPIPRGPMAGDTVRLSTGYDGFHVMHDASDPREAYLFSKWMVENKSSDFAWIANRFPAYAADLTPYRENWRYATMVDHLLENPVRRFHVFPARLDVRSEEVPMVERVLQGVMGVRESVEQFKRHADRVFSENRREIDAFYEVQEMVW